MTKRCDAIMRRLAPLLGAGVLLQATGCEFNGSAIASGVLTSIANSFITSIVFGLFNIPISGF